MFTGIVEEAGRVVEFIRNATGARLVVRAPLVSSDMRVGDSVAVNGCCLTITARDGDVLSFDLLEETLRCTNLKNLRPDSLVNFERALAANARLGGHFVQGHVDCAASVRSFTRHGSDYRLEVGVPRECAHYVAFKGSIAINGISLTVAEALPEAAVIWIIPHTMEVTNLREIKAGDLVNVEFDVLAKYIERMQQARA
jgi:riboflavin synthase